MKTKRYIHEMVLSQDSLSLTKPLPHAEGRGARVHILALGDVGATLLLGLKVLGKSFIAHSAVATGGFSLIYWICQMLK